MSIDWAPIKTTLVSLFGAAIPIVVHLIQTSSFPTTWTGWIGVLVNAATAAGLYHLPAPSSTSAATSTKA